MIQRTWLRDNNMEENFFFKVIGIQADILGVIK